MPSYSDSFKKKVLQDARRGVPAKELAKKHGIHHKTVENWTKAAGVNSRPDSKTTILQLRRQLDELSKIETPTDGAAQRIAMIAKAIARLEGISEKEIRKKLQQNKLKKPKARILPDHIRKIKEELPEKIGMYGFQKDFFLADDQFTIILKARQIGFSRTAAAKALVQAMAGVNQLFLSASEEQAKILISYASSHAAVCGITASGSETELTLENGAKIVAFAHNWRTIQGFTGDIWMDEFAWYPHPKRIWGAFVPSIGAIKGSLTILSTPFEEEGLFHQIWNNQTKYFMFDRRRVTIYDAIADGLEFDLDVMRALFDEDTWAMMYECQFADDDASFFPIALIKRCVDYNLHYYSPDLHMPLFAGYDVGRIKDVSALAALDRADENCLTLAMLEILTRETFTNQETYLTTFMNHYRNAMLRIDKTGLGMALAEKISAKYRMRAAGVPFTRFTKENMALNLRKMFEDKMIRIPNDPLLISDIHSIKRKIGQRSFLYDSDRNEHGHADRFWALALAASHTPIHAFRSSPTGGVWIY